MSIVAHELLEWHVRATSAASAGLQDAALGDIRLSPSSIEILADAAVASATPFIRAPLLQVISHVRLLHPATGVCTHCHVPAPCVTAAAVAW